MRVLVVAAHPVPESFCRALRDTAISALESGGHEVQLLDLCEEDFDAALSEPAWRGHLAPLNTKPEIAKYAEQLAWAQHLVFVYPTWFSAPPAILKGWFDRVWVEGVAYTLPKGGKRIRPLLRHVKKITIVTTHGSPKYVNAVQGESGKRLFKRGLRSLCHPLCRVQWIAIYNLDNDKLQHRQAFIAKVKRKLS